MRTVAETSICIRYASEIWSDAERQEFITFIAANPDAGVVIRGSGGTAFLAQLRQGVEDAL